MSEEVDVFQYLKSDPRWGAGAITVVEVLAGETCGCDCVAVDIKCATACDRGSDKAGGVGDGELDRRTSLGGCIEVHNLLPL